MRAPAPRLWLGPVPVDALTFADALDRIEMLIDAGRGGRVFTPNVDHVVRAERDPDLREAYRHSDLSLVDGQPLVWAARALNLPVPEKVSGSDLVVPLMTRAGARGWRVFLLGAAPGVAGRAAERFRLAHGVDVVGAEAPRVELPPDAGQDAALVQRITAARTQLLLVALGAPKQELWIHRNAARLAPAVAMGVGAALDFAVGHVRRAPAWASRAGLEWLFRLAREPRRLWRRYLVEDPRFAAILLRELRGPRRDPRVELPHG